MMEVQNSKRYDLDERTFKFAKQCRELVKLIPKTIGNFEDGKQLIRSSGSVHANYIEACEALSKKDFYHRIKICRKEAKESRSWLLFVDINSKDVTGNNRKALVQEATELTKIFGAIITKEKLF